MERKRFLPFLPRLNQCCCCFELRTGVMILGILTIAWCVMDLTKMAVFNDEDMKGHISFMTKSNSTDEESNSFVSRYRSSSSTMWFGSLVMALVLLIGAMQRNTLLLKIYVCFKLGGIIIFFFITIVLFAFIPILGVLLGIYLGFVTYFTLIVNSYLQEILDDEYAARANVEFKPV